MNENGLNYIDLFAGAGGLSEGFIQSGYRPVAHVEMNEHAAKTIETRIAYYYLKDNGKIKSYYDYEKGKITREQLLEKIPKEELKTVINKEMSESTIKGIFNTIDDIKREKEIDKIDVIIGGPPCQASRIPSWEIAQVLEKLAISYDKNKKKQGCYDVVIATNMIAVGMDVDRLGLMSVVGQPKQNSEYIQATSRVGRQHPGIIFTVYNPYRPRDLSNYENFVGFHSQMYRYVEGTTATPFAARARDRVLHALVVSLLRLQVETMADNGGASNINDISDEQIKDIKDKILERVKITAPSSYVDTEKEMDEFINTWKNIAKDEKLYYFVPTIADDKKRLLTYYGEYYGDKEKPTLSSMRDVEQSSTVFYWEGV